MRVATYLATTLSLAAFAAATSSSGSVRRDTECTTCDAVTEVTTQACSDGDLEQCATYLCTTTVLDEAAECYACQLAGGYIDASTYNANLANVALYCENFGYTMSAPYATKRTT
ncbi:uncharacterized protein EHS24_008738 [Apiotrichum porosum]|uniref:Uncharacterized protein n=1 Tax=Apiotrichum porosum TaxID=105984 RepID=A0A427XR08_9TREE|nr:uncharacterized protein EHS24_008738 [Apiotrichum porosum]RSH81296.1 hypothetical protein EHS24_008738 [Apiotrichum porosum]